MKNERKLKFVPDAEVSGLLSDIAKGIRDKRNRAMMAKRVELQVDFGEVIDSTMLSQREFADVFGIPFGTLKNWLQGRRKPPTSVLILFVLIQNDPLGTAKEIKRRRGK